MRTPAVDSNQWPTARAEGTPMAAVLALPLETTAGHLIRRAQQIHTAIWSHELDGDLTGPQYALLSALSNKSGVDQQTAGRLASLDKSTTANIVERLQRRGWIRRGRDMRDSRRNVLSLTPTAKESLPEITARVKVVQDRLLQPLGPQLRRGFIKLVGQVAYQGQVPVPADDQDDRVPVLGLSVAPGHILRRAEQVHGMFWSQHVHGPLTPPQYALLCCLAWRPATDQTAAGEMASLDKSSTADIVARLRRRNWLLDTRNDTDRRRKVLALTRQAYDALAEVTPAVQTVQRRLVEPLSPTQQDKVISLLRKVAYR